MRHLTPLAAGLMCLASWASAETWVLDPDGGKEIGYVFEAWLSPEQEPAEETEVPALAPSVFRSTLPSTDREARNSRGHGIVAFARDFSEAYMEIAVKDVPAEEVVMFHLHCGRPGMLGPILVDFGLHHDLKAEFADGHFKATVRNADLVEVLDHGSGLVGAFTAGCPILLANPLDRVRTISGMEDVARRGELYFNLHTASQTFYGDIRGQLRPMGEMTAPEQ